MSAPHPFGESVIEQALKQSFDDLSQENIRLSALCKDSSSRIDELELTVSDLRQTNDYLACQLSLVQEELLDMFSHSSLRNEAQSIIATQNQLILHQINLLQNLLA